MCIRDRYPGEGIALFRPAQHRAFTIQVNEVAEEDDEQENAGSCRNADLVTRELHGPHISVSVRSREGKITADRLQRTCTTGERKMENGTGGWPAPRSLTFTLYLPLPCRRRRLYANRHEQCAGIRPRGRRNGERQCRKVCPRRRWSSGTPGPGGAR